TYIPPDSFYHYPEADRFYPLEALGRYLAWRQGRPAPRTAGIRLEAVPGQLRDDFFLDAMRQQGDPEAEAVVRRPFDRGAVGAVNDLLARCQQGDDAVPAGLPAEAGAYFERTAWLPAWADPVRLAMAQRLFARCGWEVALGLFYSSLPQGYAAVPCARVLGGTRAMADHARRRIFETGQFLFDVLDEGALAPAGR